MMKKNVPCQTLLAVVVVIVVTMTSWVSATHNENVYQWLRPGYTTMSSRYGSSTNHIRVKPMETTEGPMRILLWNSFYERPDYGFGLGDVSLFEQKGCIVNDCLITDDRGWMWDSAAVVVMPSMGGGVDFPPDDERTPNQKWVFFSMESPLHVDRTRKVAYTDNLFNITMTYRADSDVQVTYGHVVPLNADEQMEMQKVEPRDYTEGRDRLIAWFVGKQCTDSHRLRYVRELAKHIDVDIYSKNDVTDMPRAGEHISVDELRQHYKFYLAFEEALCKDFITEKVWKSFEATVVPIVLGAANYMSVLPPNSYIDVRDFNSPEELANHLRLLSENSEMYNRYFEWKRQYRTERTPYSVDMCALCAYLHHRRNTRSIRTVSRWYNPETSCLDPHRFHEEMGVPLS